jgi:hypothetical protein
MARTSYALISDVVTIVPETNQYSFTFSAGNTFSPLVYPPGLALPKISKNSSVGITGYSASILGLAGARSLEQFQHPLEIGVHPSPETSDVQSLLLGEWEEWYPCNLVYPTENPDLVALAPREIRLVLPEGGSVLGSIDMENMWPVYFGRNVSLCLMLSVVHSGFVEGA